MTRSVGVFLLFLSDRTKIKIEPEPEPEPVLSSLLCSLPVTENKPRLTHLSTSYLSVSFPVQPRRDADNMAPHLKSSLTSLPSPTVHRPPPSSIVLPHRPLSSPTVHRPPLSEEPRLYSLFLFLVELLLSSGKDVLTWSKKRGRPTGAWWEDWEDWEHGGGLGGLGGGSLWLQAQIKSM